MEDFNKKATKEIADMIQYVASEAVDNAGYDKTRNARVTKVYSSAYNVITGYDVSVDGKSYHLSKERGKGVIAKVNDVVKLHFPCDNSNLMYLSYPHDPEDYIKEYAVNTASSPGVSNYMSYYTKFNSDVEKKDFALGECRTFPATTKQFSSITVVIPWDYGSSSNYFGSTFRVSADSGVIATLVSADGNTITVKAYNENPNTTDPVTKFFNIFVTETRIPVI